MTEGVDPHSPLTPLQERRPEEEALGHEGPEVEQPFVEQLVAMGWKHTTGNSIDPTATGRETFRDVFLVGELEKALRRINLDAQGQPWLDEGRLHQAIHTLRRPGTHRLLEANQKATELLLKGTVVDGVEGWDQGRGRPVAYIDWENPENNTFRVIDQFHLRCPTGQADKSIRPDLVLFVNGIPLVVVEAKSPKLAHPMEEGIDQLQRYANRRKALGVVDVDEGNERLFHTNQFVVATCGEQARVGTFSSTAVHCLEWKDTSPVPMGDVAAELGKPGKSLSSQEKLVAGMLRPSHLLDIVRHFTLFKETEGRSAKIVCRYQQFRAVQLAIRRLESGKTLAEDGEHDRRGGIIWHTQGSGKSLTMVFLIRKMRSHPTLRRFKVVVVTDRRDLQKQLADTAALTDEVLTVVKARKQGYRTVSASEVLQETLRREGKDLVFAMIQKYRGELVDPEAPWADEDDADEEDAGQDVGGEDIGGETDAPAAEASPPAQSEPLPELNPSEDILVLVDEAHRSHTNTTHANLMSALPNCAKIGFTGTPIIMREKGMTARIFGDFIDRYTLRQSEADGATVPILYEGRTAEAAVEGGGRLDQLFEDMLKERSDEELEAIKKKYATQGRVMEAPALIGAKARDMLRHYVDKILPNGFKAQVVAVSRRAAVRYRRAFVEARDELVGEIEALDPALLRLDDDAVAQLRPRSAFLVRAHRFLPTLRALDFAAVISRAHNDKVDPQGDWSTRAKIDARIARFKKPLFGQGANTWDHPRADPLAFLIVKSMLLTGFDAPVEQVLYLDRNIKEAELLQAVARVNRTYAKGEVEKGFGIVVDYYGVARHMKEALAAYSAEDVDGALQSLGDEIPKLRDRHHRAVDVLRSRGIDTLDDVEACVELLRDERIRAELHVKLKHFLTTLDLVLPRPEALPFVRDAKVLAYIQARARNRYRGAERLIGSEVGAKVRHLIDEHVISLGIDPRIPPIEITSTDFGDHIDRERSPRAKASEMEHALRYHIRKHLDEDPTLYQKLSERLKTILETFTGRWEDMAEALAELVAEARRGREKDDTPGLDPETQAPFFDLLKQQIVGDGAGDGTLDDPLRERLCTLTVEMVDHLRQEMAIVDFWAKAQAREALRSWIFRSLDATDLLPFERLDAVADLLMEWAKANHHRLA